MAKKTASKKKPAARNEPMVALYGLDAGTPRGDAVREVLRGLGLRVRTITPEHLNDPVGAIAGMVGMRPSPKPFEGEAPNDEFMLVCNLSGAQLDAVLSGLRQANASIAHKAQVTPHNRLWPLHVLMAEIAKEHGAMTAQSQAAQGE